MGGRALYDRVQRGLAGLHPLPPPDQLDVHLPEGSICLVTDDGTNLPVALARDLAERNWKVVILSYPETIVHRGQPIPEGLPHVDLTDTSEDQLNQKLAEISERFGRVAAFIHLNPSEANFNSEDGQSDHPEKAIVKHVFLIAKHLKEALNLAASERRAVFASVTHLDGEFGLGGTQDFNPISGGLFGLVKTLNLEWEPVFCRAIDLDPAIDEKEAADTITTEIFDPNRLLTEVGYSSKHGRQTLVVETIAGLGGNR